MAEDTCEKSDDGECELCQELNYDRVCWCDDDYSSEGDVSEDYTTLEPDAWLREFDDGSVSFVKKGNNDQLWWSDKPLFTAEQFRDWLYCKGFDEDRDGKRLLNELVKELEEFTQKGDNDR